MTEHPITPPFELVRQWSTDSPIQYNDQDWAYELFIAHHAAQWGADQELEACCEWADETGWQGAGDGLRTARRPKPPSLKEQALLVLDDIPNIDGAHYNTIRRALEALPE
jgi:hypothetical protein